MGRRPVLRPRPQSGINARISDLLAASGISQSEFAKRAGVTTSTVSKWLSDVSEPMAANAPAIASALNASVHFLLTGKETPAQREIRRDDEEKRALQAEVARLRAEVARLYAVAGQLQPLPAASRPSKGRP